jgi:integrase
MQRGCMQRNTRKEGPDVWQFRWSETRLDGKRLYRKKIVGTVEQYPDEGAARRAVVGLVSEINTDARPTKSRAMTVALNSVITSSNANFQRKTLGAVTRQRKSTKRT